MKKHFFGIGLSAIILTSLALPISSFAMEAEEYYDSNSGEEIATIRNPDLGEKVPFSERSDVNGACIALGYKQGVPGSASITGYGGSAVTVDSTGNIIGGTYNIHRLTSLMCVKKLRSPLWKGVLISPKSKNLQFSKESDKDGVCIAMGFDRGAPGSEQTWWYGGSAVTVDSQGNSIGGTDNTYHIFKLLCFNRNP